MAMYRKCFGFTWPSPNGTAAFSRSNPVEWILCDGIAQSVSQKLSIINRPGKLAVAQLAASLLGKPAHHQPRPARLWKTPVSRVSLNGEIYF